MRSRSSSRRRRQKTTSHWLAWLMSRQQSMPLTAMMSQQQQHRTPSCCSSRRIRRRSSQLSCRLLRRSPRLLGQWLTVWASCSCRMMSQPQAVRSHRVSRRRRVVAWAQQHLHRRRCLLLL
jgi:hypothetical protein